MDFNNLREAVLLRRYKRFLADVEFPDGEVVTVHCPNTGAMTGCAEPGSAVWLSTSDSKTRKYPHSWELVNTAQGMACIHSARANKLLQEALENKRIGALSGYQNLQAEVKYGEKSRLDFLLEFAQEKMFVEVKSVTLCSAGGQGLFPDAVSDRGRKHLQELAKIAQTKNTRAVLFFCVLHEGIERVSTAGEIDPRYREAMREALDAGVEVMAWRAQMNPREIFLHEAVPFTLDP